MITARVCVSLPGRGFCVAGALLLALFFLREACEYYVRWRRGAGRGAMYSGRGRMCDENDRAEPRVAAAQGGACVKRERAWSGVPVMSRRK